MSAGASHGNSMSASGDRPRLLAIGHAAETSGFARVLRAVLAQLSATYHVQQLALGDRGTAPWPIHFPSNSADVYALGELQALVERTEPAVVLVLHDPWIIPLYANALHRFDLRLIAYIPLDGEPSDALGTLPALVDRLVVYTPAARLAFAGAAARQLGGDARRWAQKIAVASHGVDTDVFFATRASPARRESFVVLNANRNQPRKEDSPQRFADLPSSHAESPQASGSSCTPRRKDPAATSRA